MMSFSGNVFREKVRGGQSGRVWLCVKGNVTESLPCHKSHAVVKCHSVNNVKLKVTLLVSMLKYCASNPVLMGLEGVKLQSCVGMCISSRAKKGLT